MSEIQQHAGNEIYDEKFFREQQAAYSMAMIIVPFVRKYIHPKTIVDVGCGVGTWIKAWENHGVEGYGIDGDYLDRKKLWFDEKRFSPTNLENPFTTNLRFDLAESLEVAEHLSPTRADGFVEDLTKLSDVILFSAAIPFQGGVNHINEQFQSYWAEKFLKCGYVGIDCIRPHIWTDRRVVFHYRTNILVYAKSTELYRYPELQKYYLDHKDTFMYDIVNYDEYAYAEFCLRKEIDGLKNEIANLKGGG